MVVALPEDHSGAEATDQVRATAQHMNLSVGCKGRGQFTLLAVLSVLTHSSSVHQEYLCSAKCGKAMHTT